uniref:E3 ubiquitin-protein ligase n=1 Tax=Gopherus agassizii TaxID=38772 RepID=A0A452GG68_9SAUR
MPDLKGAEFLLLPLKSIGFAGAQHLSGPGPVSMFQVSAWNGIPSFHHVFFLFFLQYVSNRHAVGQTSTEQGSLHSYHPPETVHDPQLIPCMCPLFSCQWEGHVEVVVSHLRQTHRINILHGAEIVFLATDMHLPAPTDWIIMHSCLGHHFLLVLRKQEKYEGHPQFFATMMLIGTPTQADNFTYRLELNRNQRRLKWEATPRSVLECIDSVISDGDCLVLNTSLAQLFSDNGSLAIGIAITMCS